MEFVWDWECHAVSIINDINVNKSTFKGCYTLLFLYAYFVRFT